jgi:hypothetical protein
MFDFLRWFACRFLDWHTWHYTTSQSNPQQKRWCRYCFITQRFQPYGGPIFVGSSEGEWINVTNPMK